MKGRPGSNELRSIRALQALGRSRGGLTTKIHLAVDGRGLPRAFVVTGGNVNDCTQFAAVLEAIRVPSTGVGRPRTRSEHVIADKGYSCHAIRTCLRRRGIGATIPNTRTSRPSEPAVSIGVAPSIRSATGGATSSNAASTGASASARPRPSGPSGCSSAPRRPTRSRCSSASAVGA
ncbi:hypothetical protein GCM10017600_57780 [Streptosporangium carneum]|uniref:Transposase IS4-like domain-containing protein n=1 Tax=Streptosporangium carneum TaxID=47481 RepID=A0A9W6I716_9ACTN|nr:hypothetical protein GCM10017600_57780 [Streptosporangium carneum]